LGGSLLGLFKGSQATESLPSQIFSNVTRVTTGFSSAVYKITLFHYRVFAAIAYTAPESARIAIFTLQRNSGQEIKFLSGKV
jgi:hypothetical protein